MNPGSFATELIEGDEPDVLRPKQLGRKLG
jgi:hypothetical protein